MSYILEALRKADAERERERGGVPNLHAQLIPLTAGRVDDEPARMPVGWWVGIGGAVLLLGLLVWSWFAAFGGAKGAVAPAAATATTALPAAPAPAPNSARSGEPAGSASSAAASAPGAALARAATPSIPIAATTPAPRSTATVAAAPKAPPPSKPRPVARPRAAPKAAAKAPAAAPTVASPGPPAAATAMPTPPVETRVPPLAELPEDVRRQVPAMAMGGSVYSTEAARSMVIVNGQVFLEGSTLAPELKLEKINPKSAVFSIRGQRFQVPL